MSTPEEQSAPEAEIQARRPMAIRVLGGIAAWGVAGAAVAGITLANESRDTNIASFEANVSVTHDGFATVNGGAAAPTLRRPVPAWHGIDVGAHIDLGQTEAKSGNELTARIGAILAQPSGEIDKVSGLNWNMIVEAGEYGGIGGLAVPVVWMLIGPKRRRELRANAREHAQRTVAVGTVLVAAGGLIGGPLLPDLHNSEHTSEAPVWVPISQVLPDIKIPKFLENVTVESNFLTNEETNLLRGGVLAFQKSQPFYARLVEKAKQLAPLLRQPGPGETVALFVADRHDNLDADPVNTAIGEAGGATIFADGGDDTSAGQAWEAFSLDSLISQTEPFNYRLEVPGNHDHGTFVSNYLAMHGFKTMDGSIVTASGIRFLGLPDPNISGFVNSESFTSATIDRQAKILADLACKADAEGNRVSTLLLHEAAAGRLALERGCVDLVLGGHLHRYVGPTEVTGENGKIGDSYTTTTAGGAAFAMSLGPLRRDAGITLVTYRGNVPIGLQKVTVTTAGELVVSEFIELPGITDSGLSTPVVQQSNQNKTLANQQQHKPALK